MIDKTARFLLHTAMQHANCSPIQEYFGKSVGPIKKVSLSYNQHGESRGIADIIFVKPDSAAKAAKEQNGIKIDGRPMKASRTTSVTINKFLTQGTG